MLRGTLLAFSRSHRLRDVVAGLPLTHRVVERFIAGETLADGLAAARRLADDGRYSSIDVLGEDVTDSAQAQVAAQSYLTLLQDVGDAGLGPWVEVSVKLSSLGGALPGGVEQATRHAREVCEAARAIGTTVTVDAEDHTTTDQTLGIVEELRADFPELGVVLQAALHRTSLDAQRVGGPGSRIRLCKGAYAEPESVARQEPADVTAGFIEVMRQLFSSGTYVMIASHDPALIAAAQDVAADCGRGRDDFEFQMLYGIRSDEQRRLAAAGYRVRVYVPCGTDWWGYFLRRLAERPANLAFFLKALVGR
ncbi:MAG: proline dehydrogenase family protein [Propionicimonas sp.]